MDDATTIPPLKNTFFIFAGEKSGDAQGAKLLLYLQKLPLNFIGVGGPAMRKAGLSCILNMEEFQVMGFLAILKGLPKIIKQFFFLKRQILKINPAIVLFIDYPGLSLALSKSLRKSGYQGKIVQFVCPSIWAYKKNRKQKLIQYYDLILTLFEFEQKLFDGSPLKAVWAGHPLADLPNSPPKENPILAIFPGSRRSEITLNLPFQLKAAREIKRLYGYEIFISCASLDLLPLIQQYNLDSYQVLSDAHHLMDKATVACATSGTVTLELALKKIPTVVTYGIKPFDEWLARNIFKIDLPFYCIVNIILEKMTFKELIGAIFTDQALLKALENIITNQEEMTRVQSECIHFKEKIYLPSQETVILDSIKSLLCL